VLVTDKGQLSAAQSRTCVSPGARDPGVIVFDTAEDEHVVSVDHIGEEENGENGNGGN